MRIAFCGHRTYSPSQEHRKKLLDFFSSAGQNAPLEFWLGGYGKFDKFAYSCCKEFQRTENSGVKLVFITPYVGEYLENRDTFTSYDEVVYPPIETAPKRYAISYRNRYIAENCDILISYIRLHSGGAYSLYRLAKKNGKQIIEL